MLTEGRNCISRVVLLLINLYFHHVCNVTSYFLLGFQITLIKSAKTYMPLVTGIRYTNAYQLFLLLYPARGK